MATALRLLQPPEMKLEIDIGGVATQVELQDGSWRLGGGEEDAVVVPGLPPGRAELRIEGERLMIVAEVPFRVDGVLSPGGVPRLILDAERIGLGEGVFIRVSGARAPVERPQTAMVLKELLGGMDEPEDTTCASLTCLTGLDAGRKFPLAGEQMDVGRGDTVELRVRDRAVSRRHARLRRTAEGGYCIEDLGAPNGLFVNGSRVKGPLTLPDGAVIEMGHSLLRYRGVTVEPPAPAQEPSQPELPPGSNAGAAASDHGANVAGGDAGADASTHSLPGATRQRRVLRRVRAEHALLGVGVGLALLGAVVTWNFLVS